MSTLPDSYEQYLESDKKRIIFMIRFRNLTFYGEHGDDGGGVVWRSYEILPMPPLVPYTGPWATPGGYGDAPYSSGCYGR